MVKINKTLGLALLTALAASCSSDNDVAQAPEPVNNNGVAYATLRIDLPTQQGSRAVSFDYNNDISEEYKVYDATLLVFKQAGNSEGDYTFVEKVDLGDMEPWTEKNTDGITTTADVTAKLSKATLTDLTQNKCYGLVILNNKADDGSDKITIPDEGTKYSVWNDPSNAKAMKNTKKGFVMANAPGWKKSGEVPTTLVPIKGDHVKATETLAKGVGPAAEIHVERGLAKVTLTLPNDAKEVTVNSGNSQYNGDKVTFDGWALDVTNTKSFPVHNIDGLNLAKNYTDIWTSDGTASTKENSPSVRRFVDGANPTFKRVYWGIDPNYNKAYDDCKGDFNIITESTWESSDYNTLFGVENPLYCLENTFDIDHMQQGQTTRVLIKATYKKGGKEATFYKLGSSSKLYTAKELEDALTERYLDLNPDVDEENLTVTLNAKDNDITKAGVHSLKAANFLVKTSSTPAKPRTRGEGHGESEHPTPVVVPTEQITTYENGICYYIGRIKHFGDDETPWHVGDPTYTDTDANKKWLGRYGVLRNNWYSLSVNKVSGPGEPTVPPINPTDPDDDNYNYIDLSVKILQWAKRTQDLDL